jgi:hypothetical protein
MQENGLYGLPFSCVPDSTAHQKQRHQDMRRGPTGPINRALRLGEPGTVTHPENIVDQADWAYMHGDGKEGARCN